MPFPYTFPFAFDAGYFVEVDFDADGNFTDANDDLTINTKSIRYSRGKDDELGKAKTGDLTVTLNNASGLYTPTNSAGALYLSLLPRRAIKVYYSSAGVNYNLYYGYIEEIIPHPHKSEQDCVITALDGLDYLARQELDTVLSKSVLTGALVTTVLDDAGWSATLRAIDAGQDTVPYGYFNNVMARYALGEIEDSELGFIYINGSGNLVFEDRHHRYSATHQTSQATFSDTMLGITYSLNPKNIFNIVRATITPWSLTSITELWRLQEEPLIPAGATMTWWGDAAVGGESVFVDAWTTPEAADYAAWTGSGGTGTDMSASLTITTTKLAKTIKLVVVNNATTPVYLYLLKARGTYYDNLTRVTRKAEDTTSQGKYQKRTLTRDGKFMTSAAKAQDYASYAISRYKDPQGEVAMTLTNKNSTILTQLLTRELSDRITVVNTALGISGDYFIDAMEHLIELSGLKHTTTYRLRDASNEDFWCLDYSALGTGTKLGY